MEETLRIRSKDHLLVEQTKQRVRLTRCDSVTLLSSLHMLLVFSKTLREVKTKMCFVQTNQIFGEIEGTAAALPDRSGPVDFNKFDANKMKIKI